MIDLGALKLEVTLDDKEANKSLKEIDKNIDATDKTLKEHGNSWKDFGSKIGSIAKTGLTAVGAGLTAVGGAMLGVTAKALETTSTIEKFSKTCNVSTDEYQKLDGVMQTMGWSMEDAAGDFAALSEKMMEAATTGEGEAYEMFQKLGVETTNLDGSLRNTGDVFNDMILSLQNMGDATEKQAIASIMLGTTSEELAPLLSMTNEEFLKMKDNVNVIDEEQLNKAADFKKSWEQVKQTFTTVVTELGVSLMPMFQSLADWVNKHMPTIQKVIDIAFKVVNQVIGSVVTKINELMTWFTNLFKSNEKLGKDLSTLWNKVKEMFSTFFKDVQELLDAFSSACKKIWDKYGEDIMKILEPMWKQIKNIFKTGFDLVKGLVDFFTALFEGDFEGMKKAITGIIDSMWEFVKNSFNNSIDFLEDFIPTMLQVGKDLFNGLWDGIKSVWSGISDWISEKVEWIADKLMFWKNAESEMSSGTKSVSTNTRSIDGSHFNGIERIPFDGYKALLHKNEMVLNAQQAEAYRNNTNSVIPNISLKQEILVKGDPDREMLKLLRKETDRIAKYTCDKIMDGVYSRGYKI